MWGLQEKVTSGGSDQVTFRRDLVTRSRDIERMIHKTIKKVTEDIEAMKYNTAIAAMMTLLNELSKQNYISHSIFHILIQLLNPFAPHITEELNEQICRMSRVSCRMLVLQPWPLYNPALIKDKEIELVVQVNGRVRDRLKTAADISKDEAKTVALQSEKIKTWLTEKTVQSVIFVPGKLINIVVGD